MSFTAKESGDLVKRDLELTCDECDALICDIEDGDSLGTLVAFAAEHECSDAMDQGEHILLDGPFTEPWRCTCGAIGESDTFIQHTIESGNNS